jgi:hypothetical protein
MNSPTLTKMTKMTTTTNDLPTQLLQLGLHATAHALDDFLARATKSRWSPRLILEELTRAEVQERSRRSLERGSLRSSLYTAGVADRQIR